MSVGPPGRGRHRRPDNGHHQETLRVEGNALLEASSVPGLRLALAEVFD